MSNDTCKMSNLKHTEIYKKAALEAANGGIGLVPFEANLNEKLFETLGNWCIKPIKEGEEFLGSYGIKY